MNKERLEQTIRVLEDVESSGKSFDLATWHTSYERGGECACAVGWATQDTWHQAQGLHLASVPWYRDGAIMVSVPEFDGLESTGAVTHYYGITVDQMRFLFMRSSYGDGTVRPHNVIFRIRAMLNAYTAIEAELENA